MRPARVAAVCLVMAAVVGTGAILGSNMRHRQVAYNQTLARPVAAPGAPAAPAATPSSPSADGETGGYAGAYGGYTGTALQSNVLAGRDGYFAECRMARDRARSAREEVLTSLLDTSPEPQVRSQIQTELSSIAREADLEVRAEALIKARGYPDAVVILSPTGASVVVASAGLDARAAQQVGEIVARVAGLPLKSIVILERSL